MQANARALTKEYSRYLFNMMDVYLLIFQYFSVSAYQNQIVGLGNGHYLSLILKMKKSNRSASKEQCWNVQFLGLYCFHYITLMLWYCHDKLVQPFISYSKGLSLQAPSMLANGHPQVATPQCSSFITPSPLSWSVCKHPK